MTCAFSRRGRAGRLTLAARRLGRTTPPSAAAHSLESALKANLFERRPQGYALTGPASASVAGREHRDPALAAAERNRRRGPRSVGHGPHRHAGRVRDAVPRPARLRLGEAIPRPRYPALAMPRLLSLSKREADVAIACRRPRRARSSPESSATTASPSMRRSPIWRRRPDDDAEDLARSPDHRLYRRSHLHAGTGLSG